MIKSIEFSKPYALRLSEVYGGTKYNCIVIGVTNIDNVAQNQEKYNIYETFFVPIGLGLTSYYTAVSQTTNIYICKLIDSLEPFNITEEKVFIPETLINFETSAEYIECTNYNFEIYPIIRRFTSSDEKNIYEKEIVDKLKDRLHGLVDFANLDSQVNIGSDTIYLEREDIESIENNRSDALKRYVSRKSNMINTQMQKESQYNSLYSQLASEKAKYERLNKELEDAKIKMEDAAARYEAAIKGL